MRSREDATQTHGRRHFQSFDAPGRGTIDNGRRWDRHRQHLSSEMILREWVGRLDKDQIRYNLEMPNPRMFPALGVLLLLAATLLGAWVYFGRPLPSSLVGLDLPF